MTEKEIQNITTAMCGSSGAARAGIYANERARLLPVMNANTISADLKRVVIMQESIRAFARRLLPLRAFSTVFNAVPLQGTGEVVVPYYPLNSTGSTEFVAGTGYAGTAGMNQSAKKINLSQTAGGKRKYQWLSWTSAELREQPFMNLAAALTVQLEQLGVDIFNDVLSVVTAANFTEAPMQSSAAGFDSDDLADVSVRCDQLDWPEAGRSFMLDSAYKGSLLKDAAIKKSFDFGNPNAVQEGQVARVVGFDLYPNPRIPTNGQALKGFAVFRSAVLVATAIVDPTPEVRSQLSIYESIVEPETGIAIEHRRWGNPDMDSTRETVECSYGYAVGESKALVRLVEA